MSEYIPAVIAKAVDHRVGQRTKPTCQDGKNTFFNFNASRLLRSHSLVSGHLPTFVEKSLFSQRPKGLKKIHKSSRPFVFSPQKQESHPRVITTNYYFT